MSNEQQKWVTIAQAASEAGLPVRTAYNWARSGSITSRKEDGTTFVLITEVLAKAREREAATSRPALLPAASAGAQPPATDAGNDAARHVEVLPQEARAALPPELLAYLIRLFEQGMPLQSIVEQLRLPPLLVIEARRQYDSLVAAGGQPTVSQRLSAMEEHVRDQLEGMDARLSQSEEFHTATAADAQSQAWRRVEPYLLDLYERIRGLQDELTHAHRLIKAYAEMQDKSLTALEDRFLDLVRARP